MSNDKDPRDIIDTDLLEDIDTFEQQIQLAKEGRLEEKVFAEIRLRQGVYGQRYDNGQRHDGNKTQTLEYPSGNLVKGPNTLWDAPGMQRIKVPYGGLNAEQMEALADVSDLYADGISHITTRQDIQLHFIHIEDTPPMMRRLAEVGITVKEACGNVIRNITACPLAGVCHTESFDVAPYAHVMFRFFLGHPDAQDFGRKFKISFSGCVDHPCGLVSFHDIGLVAKTRDAQRGFEFYVGGGLGAVPQQAKLMYEFVPEGEILPLSQAICRVFAQHGEKKNRARARLKFLINKLGFEEFKAMVEEERKQLTPDSRWQGLIDDARVRSDAPNAQGKPLQGEHGETFDAWKKASVRPQRQENFSVVTLDTPLGDISSWQMRRLADIARRYANDNVRLSVEQNLLLRWVSDADLPKLFEEVRAIGLGGVGAESIVDITACPGTDTCKLGHSSSRGLAAELRERLLAQGVHNHEAVGPLRIKVSGCFNSCGQHHVADIGFYGVGRKVRGYMVPHFQLILGGQWSHNAGSFGLAIGALPSKNVPAAVSALTQSYLQARTKGESFQEFVKRMGKVEIKKLVADLQKVPDYEVDPSFYSDWGDPREYTTSDLGVGECAGEIVSLTDFGLSESERKVFDAQMKLDADAIQDAAMLALSAMSTAARALLQNADRDVPDDAAVVLQRFKNELHDTKVFHDPYAGAKFATFYLKQAEAGVPDSLSKEAVRQRVEEAQLFIEAAHACFARMDTAEAA